MRALLHRTEHAMAFTFMWFAHKSSEIRGNCFIAIATNLHNCHFYQIKDVQKVYLFLAEQMNKTILAFDSLKMNA